MNQQHPSWQVVAVEGWFSVSQPKRQFMFGRKLPQITITAWLITAWFYTMYGWYGDIDSSYPIFVFFHNTVIPVTLIILPISGLVWLLWFTGKEPDNIKLFVVAFLMLIGNGMAFITVFRVPDEYRYHGTLEYRYYLGSQWVHGGEGPSGAIYSVYDCDWIIIRCNMIFQESFSMEWDEFEAIGASIIVENELAKVVIENQGVYEIPP